MLWNEGFVSINPLIGDHIRVGVTFEVLIRLGLAAGAYPNAVGREKEWLAERLAVHRDPGPPFEIQSDDGPWFLLSEQKFGDWQATMSVDITA